MEAQKAETVLSAVMYVYILLLGEESCLAKSARCYKAELFYDVVKSRRRHWLAVTLSFNNSLSDGRVKLRVTATQCLPFDFTTLYIYCQISVQQIV